ncbi:MAG TPA: SBBP repeat-containing protein [Bryobacteraceae bacterium]|nr:SBBP repeat-containing protein [Bryobacteraceae bacterium]
MATVIMLPLAAQTPKIQWARQFGSIKFDQANAVGYGEFGVYSAGETHDTITGQASAGDIDAYISLHDESGNLKWIRQFGTPAADVATGVAADGSGAYVVGYTSGAIGSQIGAVDSFIRKYGPTGNVLWTRQFGTVTDDFAFAVAAHPSGVYVVGQIDCCGSNFPGLPATLSADGYIRKYSGDGTELWTRMIVSVNAEKALGVAVDDTGVYVVGTTNGDLVVGANGGRDGFLRKYGHDGAMLWTRQFGTFLANGDGATDDAYAVAVGPAGVFVVGATAQGTLPGSTFVGGLWDAFLVKFDPATGNPQWYRQIGTDGDDFAYAVAVGTGYVLVAGGTGSDLVNGAFVGGEDAFLRLYDFDGNVLGTQQFGDGLNDSGRGVVAYSGGFFVAGTKGSLSLNLEPVGDNDLFVMKVVPPPFVAAGGVLNGASFASPAPLAPGSLAVVFGAYLNDGPQVLSTSLDTSGKVVTSLGGTSVLVNNVPAPILYSVSTQVAIQIPFELASQTIGVVTVGVGGQFSDGRGIGIAPAAPGIFTRNQAGTGEAIVVHQDGVTVVTPQNPAKRNEVVVIYATGLGVLNPALGTGVPAGANMAQAQMTIAFGAANGIIEYAGAAPGFVGLNQINARIPAGAPIASDVPISISVGGRTGNPVTVAIGQ